MAGFESIDLDYLPQLIRNEILSEETAAKLIEYWQSRLADSADPLGHSYIEYYLFFEGLQHGVALAFIWNATTRKFEHLFGIYSAEANDYLERAESFLKDTEDFQEEITKEGGKFLFWGRKLTYDEKNYAVGFLFPQTIELPAMRITTAIQKYFIPEIYREDSRMLPLFPEVDAQQIREINAFLERDLPVTFTYFRFDDFRQFISFSGDFFAEEMIRVLSNTIEGILKQSDECIILNPQEFLVISLNCTEKVMRARFKKVVFQYKGLIMTYKANYFTVKNPIGGLWEVWPSITGELSKR